MAFCSHAPIRQARSSAVTAGGGAVSDTAGMIEEEDKDDDEGVILFFSLLPLPPFSLFPVYASAVAFRAILLCHCSEMA